MMPHVCRRHIEKKEENVIKQDEFYFHPRKAVTMIGSFMPALISLPFDLFPTEIRH